MKISNEHFNLCEAEISLDEIIKSINSETNNKPPGSDGFKAEFYKHSSNELASVLLDVYDSWGKLDTMGVTYRTGITSAKNFIVHILSTICAIIDESNKLNKNLSVISLKLILSFLLCISSDIETEHIPISNLKLK